MPHLKLLALILSLFCGAFGCHEQVEDADSAAQLAPGGSDSRGNTAGGGNTRPGFSLSWTPSAPPHAWKYIVIHHSDTDSGSAVSFDRYHREVKGWNGLGYDFVIGNGYGAPDGQVQPGPRWHEQRTGAHAGIKKYNEDGIGICLVGNFDNRQPTPAQMESLARLTGYLMRTYHIPPQNIIGHHDTGRATNCPGRYLSIARVRQLAGQFVGVPVNGEPVASGELLRDVP